MNQKTADSPLVSLVIPVYNAMPYLVETLDAIENQGLDEDQLDVVLVNDGSTDGSEKVLTDYAQRHPNYRLINQPNSGGPADPCNKGIAAATGKYFFVVGSDDVLTEGALGELTAYAEKHRSDIVLAKMAGLNGRHAPESMFKETKADAHLVKDRLFNSLTAIKLFRRDLVTKTGAYNPPHLRVGSDQPFTAACYLAAGKISVCADRPYVMIRKREDGKNVTSSPRTSGDYVDLLTAVMDVIITWTEPGALRDGVLHRPVFGVMRRALLPRFLDVDEEAQERIVTEMQRVMGPHFNDAVASHLGSFDRVKARLALAHRVDDLRALIGWEKGGGKPILIHDGDGFRLDLPPELVERVGVELLRDVKVVGVATLEDILVEDGRIRLEASAYVRDAVRAPSDAVLRLRRRDTEELTDHPVLERQPVTISGAQGVRFHVEIDPASLGKGVWDLYLVQRFGEEEVENRLGRNRSELVTDERRHLVDDTRPHGNLGVAYFTKGYGNLSLDIGYTLLARTGPEAVVVGVLETEPGHRIALLRTVATASLELSVLRGGDAHGTGTKPHVAHLEGGLIAVSVPEGFESIRLADPHGAVVLPLPKAVGFAQDDARRVTAPTSRPTAMPTSRPGTVERGLRTGRDLARRLGVRRPGFLKRR